MTVSLLDAAQAQQPADPDDANETPDQEQAEQTGPATEDGIADLQQAIQSKIPPEQQEAVQRIVLAGQKVLYSPGTSNMLMEEIQGNDPVDKKLAGGTAGLMALLNQQANGSIPPGAYIPAASLLLLDIADVMVKAKQQITMQDVTSALGQMSAAILAKHGVPPGQIKSAVVDGQPPTDPNAPVAPTAPAPTQPPQPVPGGP